MNSTKSRIEKAERQVGTNRAPLVIAVVDFSGGPLPPEEKRGNIITRYVWNMHSLESRVRKAEERCGLTGDGDWPLDVPELSFHGTEGEFEVLRASCQGTRLLPGMVHNLCGVTVCTA